MKKIVNSTHLEGYLFSHDLQLRVTGADAKAPNTEYITGSLEVMTDESGLNVVPVNFRYVTELTKAGKKNATFATLMTIINSEKKTYQEVGPEAYKLKIDTALGLNDFYNAQDELISYKLNDGGFVHIVPTFTDNRNRFEVDVLITNVAMKEADEERNTPDMVIVKGATFNFMGNILPVDFVVKTPGGMKYFEDLGATAKEPVFLKVWGEILCSTIETQTTEESAFGEDVVKISSRKLKEWVITGASTIPYLYGDEAVLTPAEVEKAMGDRETYLAETKQRHDEWMASKGTAATAGTGAPATKDKNFQF